LPNTLRLDVGCEAAADRVTLDLEQVADADVAPEYWRSGRGRRNELPELAVVDDQRVRIGLVEMRNDRADANRIPARTLILRKRSNRVDAREHRERRVARGERRCAATDGRQQDDCAAVDQPPHRRRILPPRSRRVYSVR